MRKKYLIFLIFMNVVYIGVIKNIGDYKSLLEEQQGSSVYKFSQWILDSILSFLGKGLDDEEFKVEKEKWEEKERKREEERKNNKDYKYEKLSSWGELVQMHYIWVAFMEKLINIHKEETKKFETVVTTDLEIDSEIKSFFHEDAIALKEAKMDSTLKGLAIFFGREDLKSNFTKDGLTFMSFIETFTQGTIKKGSTREIIDGLLEEVKKNNGGKNIHALWCVFTVAFGRYYTANMPGFLAKKKAFSSDERKCNTCDFLINFLEEERKLFEKLENLFISLYKQYGRKITENFINDINQIMYNTIGFHELYLIFINLIYRNKGKNSKGEITQIDTMGQLL